MAINDCSQTKVAGVTLLPQARYEARARIAKALAHPARLLMLDALQAGEQCVCELTALVGLDQSTVSKHLALLKQAGIIADRRKGNMVMYRLKITCLQGFWGCVETVLRQNLRDQQAAIES
jgi:ArsR family transcriptional regulator